MTALLSFLKRNTIIVGEALPLVHSTDSLFIKGILSAKKIDSKNDCEVFGEHLNYFFVGRPAYKREIGHEAEYWELPCCFVLNDISAKPKRIYPFDSGAFRSKSKLYPQFITMMNLDEFEISKDPRAIEKVIGTFFTSRARYFSLKPRDPTDFRRRFGIEVTDEEIAALYKLIEFKGGGSDDRRLSI